MCSQPTIERIGATISDRVGLPPHDGVPDVQSILDQTVNEFERLENAHAALKEHGIAEGRHGYDLTTLAAAVYGKNWSYGIDLETGSYQAVIRTGSAGSNQSSVSARSSRVRDDLVSAYGETPEDALAFALVDAIGRSASR